MDNIDVGTMKLSFNRLPKIDADIVIVFDQIKEKQLQRIHHKIHKAMEKHKEFFKSKDWFDTKKFKNLLEADLLSVLNKYRRFIGEEQEDEIHESMGNLTVLEGKQAEVYRKEQLKLIDIIKNVKQPILKRIRALNEFEKLSKKAEILSQQQYSEIEHLKKSLYSTFDTERTRLSHYLQELKSKVSSLSARKGQIRDVYLNLYSLSNKLKEIGNVPMSREFKLMSQKANDENPKLNELLLKILELPDDINYYLKE